MSVILDLLYICLIVVIIVDISGIIDSIKSGLGKLLNIKDSGRIRLKPFDCSFCMNFWCGLIYLVLNNEVTLLTILIVLIYSTLTVCFKDLIWNIRDYLTKLINKI